MFGGRFITLVALSLAMTVGALIGGLIPIKLSVKMTGVNYFSFFGMGILIGTSLVLIIPEGIKVLYLALTPDQFELNGPFYAGISLVLGFMVMFIQDNLPMIIHTIRPGSKFTYVVLDSSAPEPSLRDSTLSIFQSSLTLGLILHSFIDGVSLGSSFILEDATMGVIFFFIIIIHKLPTAFSLTSLLIKQGFHMKLVQIHLIVFSLMTPIGAIVTYVFITISNTSNQFIVAILFLFSAGTFLYVIHHVMAEIASRKNSDSEENSHCESSLSAIEFLISVAGACIPIVFSFFDDV